MKMKCMKKIKYSMFVLVFLLLFTCILNEKMTLTANAGEVSEASIVHSGKTNNISWSIDSNGHLLIEGKGDPGNQRWRNYSDEIITAEVNVTDITTMTGFFTSCGNLISADLRGSDLSDVEDMWGLFYDCRKLKNVYFKDCDTSKLYDVSSMFFACESLEELDLTWMETQNLINVESAFAGCSNLKSLNVSNWNVSKVKNFSYVFNGCESLETVDISKWENSIVNNVKGMFSVCFELKEIDLSGFDMSNVTTATDLFSGSDKLLKIHTPKNLKIDVPLPEVSDSTMNWEDEKGLICNKLPKNQASSNVLEVKTFAGEKTIFEGMSGGWFWSINNKMHLALTGSGELGNKEWLAYAEDILTAEINVKDTSNLSGIFKDCMNLNSVDLTGTDTSKVTDMSYMFSGCENLTSIDLSGIDTQNVIDVSYMFAGCKGLTELDFSGFDFKKLSNGEGMINDCVLLRKVQTPCNLNCDILLPVNNKFDWKSENDTVYKEFAKNNATSIELKSCRKQTEVSSKKLSLELFPFFELERGQEFDIEVTVENLTSKDYKNVELEADYFAEEGADAEPAGRFTIFGDQGTLGSFTIEDSGIEVFELKGIVPDSWRDSKSSICVYAYIDDVLVGKSVYTQLKPDTGFEWKYSIKTDYDEGLFTENYAGVSEVVLCPGMTFSLNGTNISGENVNITPWCFEDNDIFTGIQSEENPEQYNYMINKETEPGEYILRYVDPDYEIDEEIEIKVISPEDLSYEIGHHTEWWNLDEWEKIEGQNIQTDSNVYSEEDASNLQLIVRGTYRVGDVDLFFSDTELVNATGWKSSNEDVLTIDENGSITPNGFGASNITCNVGENTLEITIYILEDGVYITRYNDVSRTTIGKSYDLDFSYNQIGNIVPDELKEKYHAGELNMVLDEKTIEALNAKNLMGVIREEFIPGTGYHTVYAIKGTGGSLPLIFDEKDLTGMTLSGYIVVNNQNCTCDVNDWPMLEGCNCYLNDDNLFDIHLTNPDGKEEIVKRVPFTIEILEDTVHNNRKIIQDIEDRYKKNGTISPAEKMYLIDLLFQIRYGHSSYDSEDNIQFPLPEYEHNDYKKISKLMEKGLGNYLDMVLDSNITVDNLIYCASLNVDGKTPSMKEQTLAMSADETNEISDETEEIVGSNKEVICSYDLAITRETNDEGTVEVTETPVPLDVTIETGINLDGENVSLIREHTDPETGETEAEIIPATVDGTKVSFTSDLFSQYTLVKTKKCTLKAPSEFKASLYGYDDVKLSWKKVSGASGYNIYYKKADESDFAYLGRTANLYYKKSNLEDGIKYQFKIVPYKGKDRIESVNSKETSIYTLKKLENPSVERYSSTKIKISWGNIEGESGYQISKSTSKTKTSIVSTVKSTTADSKTLTVTRNKKYYYKVRAYKTVGSKKHYTPWSDVTDYNLRYVGTPSSAKASIYKEIDNLKFSWSKTTGANSYDVYYKKATDEAYEFLKTTTSTSVILEDLEQGCGYKFKVVPFYRAEGEEVLQGTAKESATVYTLKKLDAPLVVKYSSKKVKVSWENISGETGYQIARATSPTGKFTTTTYATTTGKSKTFSVTKGKTYYYKVRVYKTVDGVKRYSEWSDLTEFVLQ